MGLSEQSVKALCAVNVIFVKLAQETPSWLPTVQLLVSGLGT